MGFSDRDDYPRYRFSQVNLDEFKRTTFPHVLGYLMTWGFILAKTVMIAMDAYTCICLLAMNRWTSDIQPRVSFEVCRWLFTGCILFSFIILLVRSIWAIRIIRKDNIALAYTNVYAQNYYTMRGYRYYCLFSAVAKPEGTLDRTAFFVFFTLQDSLGLIAADGPRQAINAISLSSLVALNSSFFQSLSNIRLQSRAVALAFVFMTLSLLIWGVFMILLIVAILAWLPIRIKIKRGLGEYCCYKVDKRIKYKLEKNKKRFLQVLAEENARPELQPTVPSIPQSAPPPSSSLGSYDDKKGYGVSVTELSTIATEDRLNLPFSPAETVHSWSNFSTTTQPPPYSRIQTPPMAKEKESNNNNNNRDRFMTDRRAILADLMPPELSEFSRPSASRTVSNTSAGSSASVNEPMRSINERNSPYRYQFNGNYSQPRSPQGSQASLIPHSNDEYYK